MLKSRNFIPYIALSFVMILGLHFISILTGIALCSLTIPTAFAASAPQNRLISPAEVASLAVFIASERRVGMTGQAINVDGGAVMV